MAIKANNFKYLPLYERSQKVSNGPKIERAAGAAGRIWSRTRRIGTPTMAKLGGLGVHLDAEGTPMGSGGHPLSRLYGRFGRVFGVGLAKEG